MRLVQQRDAVGGRLQAIHEREYKTFFQKHAGQFFAPTESVWVSKRVELPPCLPQAGPLVAGSC